MQSITLINKKSFKRLKWKNGLGHTDEIGIFPENADLRRGDFLWRLSTARIEHDSAFSVFPNHDRFLLIIAGNGVRLTHQFEEGGDDDSLETQELLPLAPYEFPGDVPSGCQLLDGPVSDLSLFIQKGMAEAMMEAMDIDEAQPFLWPAKGKWNFIFVMEGGVKITSRNTGSVLTPEPGDAVSVEMREERFDELSISGAGKVCLISIHG